MIAELAKCHNGILIAFVDRLLCRMWQGFEGGNSCSQWRWSFIVFLSRHRSIDDQSSIGVPPWAGLRQCGGRNETAATDY